MTSRYHELMDKIEVTDAMRARILSRLDEAADPPTPAAPPKVVPLAAVRRYLAVAACLAVVLVGALTLPRWLDRPEDPPTLATNEMLELSDAAALSQAVGFDVQDVDACLPFPAESAVYLSYWGEMAEIQYEGEGQSAAFRKSVGTQDNSGDFTDYAQQTECAAGSITATLKGNDGYTLAVWTDGVYAFSLRLSMPQSAEQWDAILSALSE